MPLRTPFYNRYLELGAQMVDFFGVDIPWNVRSVDEEVEMVRQRVGFIDYTNSNLTSVTGRDAIRFLQKVLANDLNKIRPGKAIYSTIMDETGKVLDDGTALWVDESSFIYNGAWLNKPHIDKWFDRHSQGMDVAITDLGFSFLAFQGPKSRELLRNVADIADLPYYGVKRGSVGDIPAVIARIGFTGELGYECYVHPLYSHDLWNTLLEIGKDDHVGPYGWGATLVMGLEKGFLWGADFYEGSTALEVGLGWTVGFDKEDFIGKDVVVKRKEAGLNTRLVVFEVSDPQIVAAGTDKLFKSDKEVGYVTNALYGVSIGKSIGRACVNIESANEGEALELEHEGMRVPVTVGLKKDWYDPENTKVRS